MGVKYTPTRQRAKSIAKSLWRIWQKAKDKPYAEDLAPAIRDQIIVQLQVGGLSPEDIAIPDHLWRTFILRCQTARNPTDPS